ncbi:hypothetical protein XENORESO_014061 [Xenotaenia resolanae]|uniref:Uncharacterized protein n=1 Tax=Xenotaenia resolanae TaxID=208358 RepID=A0ABV0X8J2_9TELE
MPTAGHPADCQRDSLTVSVFQWVVEAVPVCSRLMLRKLHMYCVTKTFTAANRTGTGWLIQVELMTRCMFRCGSRWLPLQRTLLSSAVRHQEAEANSGKDFRSAHLNTSVLQARNTWGYCSWMMLSRLFYFVAKKKQKKNTFNSCNFYTSAIGIK